VSSNKHSPLRYIAGYSPELQQQVQRLLDEHRLGEYLYSKYRSQHKIANDAELREYVMEMKNRYMRKSEPLSKVVFDNRIHVIDNALGLHTYASRVQGDKLKRKNEIRISATFKQAPEPLLRMIAVHELAHLKEKEHNKDFYQLCEHMLPDYHQLEFDARLFLMLTASEQ
jgi:predicted metal-dependent hydrolase